MGAHPDSKAHDDAGAGTAVRHWPTGTSEVRDRRTYHHRALIGIGALSIVGTAAELSILGHYQSPTQLVPYAVLAGLAMAFWRVRNTFTTTTVRVLRTAGVVAIGVAALGSWFHFEANLGLAREIDPTRSGLAYLWSGVTGKIPFLAPLVIAQIGLILLAATVQVSRAAALVGPPRSAV